MQAAAAAPDVPSATAVPVPADDTPPVTFALPRQEAPQHARGRPLYLLHSVLLI